MEPSLVKMIPFRSSIDMTFWLTIGDWQLKELKLKDERHRLFMKYVNDQRDNLPAFAFIDDECFTQDLGNSIQKHDYICKGELIPFSLKENFKKLNKIHLIKQQLEMLIDKSRRGILSNDLENFVLLLYSNIKKFQFLYWFSYCSFVWDGYEAILLNRYNVLEKWSKKEMSLFNKQFFDWEERYERRQSYFLIDKKSFNLFQFTSFHNKNFLKNIRVSEIYFGFVDTSSHANYFGVVANNLLMNIISYLKMTRRLSGKISLKLFALRQNGTNDASPSSIFHIQINLDLIDLEKEPKYFGWERNSQGKLAGTMVDMSKSLDPLQMAKTSTNLNLELMKWRLVPTLNLESIKSLKCLLLGSGTLGCSVARNLIGWGVTHITFVDNSTVSYSNPTRQSLFTFDDAEKRREKSVAAADAIKKIIPFASDTINGRQLKIPMPGHYSQIEQAEILNNIRELRELIEGHDVIFLLTDSREGRYLPTLLCSMLKKLAITVALGFDTFLILRHGHSVLMENESERLGCYFCNDVVAPSNSQKDRTLDQQCTVTRPGLSTISSSMAVELLVSLCQLQHDHREMIRTDTETCLSLSIPHQIRGQLYSNEFWYPVLMAYDKCIACSKSIVELASESEEFILKILENPLELECISGITEMMANIDMNDIVSIDSSSDEIE